MAQVVYGGICLQAIWAVVALKLLGDFSPWGNKTAYLGSATGTFVNRNSLATYLGFGIVLGIGILSERSRQRGIRATRKGTWRQQLDYGDLTVAVGLLFLLIGLVYTQSRLGLAASMTGTAVTLALLRQRAGVTSGRLAAELLALVAAVLVAVSLVAAGEGVAERVLFLGNESVDRLAIYAQTLHMLAARPFTGFGMDAFGMAFEAFRAPPLLAPVTYDLAHNSYLMLWAEFGLVFGSVPMLALVAIGALLWRRLRSDDGFRGIAAAGLGALALGAVHSLGDFSLEIPANTYLLMMILGLGIGRQSRRRATGSGPAQAQATLAPVEPFSPAPSGAKP
nr:O-antigen ligase family protein [Gemmobacter straminiformis]